MNQKYEEIENSVEVPRFFKYLVFGHTVRNFCGSDRKESCWKRGELDQNHRVCNKEPKSMTCADLSLSSKMS